MKRTKPADDSDEKLIQAITDLPIAIARLEKRINDIEEKQTLILQYHKTPNDKIDAASKAFEKAIKEWMPVKWSSLPMWLDGIDQLIRAQNVKINDLCTLVAQFVRKPAPAGEPKLRGLMLGAMKEIAAALKEEPDGNKGPAK